MAIKPRNRALGRGAGANPAGLHFFPFELFPSMLTKLLYLLKLIISPAAIASLFTPLWARVLLRVSGGFAYACEWFLAIVANHKTETASLILASLSLASAHNNFERVINLSLAASTLFAGLKKS